MSNEEFGCYFRLLCIQWNNGFVTDEHFQRIGRGMADPSLNHIKTKFVLDNSGVFKNRRMEDERVKQQEYRENKRKAGLAGADKRWHADGIAIAHPLAKDSSPSPSPSPTGNRERAADFPEAVVPKWEEVKTLADMSGIEETVARGFFDHYDSKNLWANKHGSPVNVRGCLMVWNNNQKKINASNSNNRTNGKSRNDGTYNANLATDAYSHLVQ
jgi:hypothetical protein